MGSSNKATDVGINSQYGRISLRPSATLRLSFSKRRKESSLRKGVPEHFSIMVVREKNPILFFVAFLTSAGVHSVGT